MARRRPPAPDAPRPEVLAFLRHIKDNPPDDTPRLILADFLQGQAGPRGGVVRLQCRRRRLHRDTPLHLWRNFVSPLGAGLLADAPLLERLSTLNLAFTYLGPEGAGILLRSPRLARLTRLDLTGNDVGNGGIDVLVEATHLDRLTELD